MNSEIVKETLAKSTVHNQWENDFRTPENHRFYEGAFDRIAALLGAPSGAHILDVGCGVGAHSHRLARRGFRVTGVDFSEAILEEARGKLLPELKSLITYRQADILSLPFEDRTFDYILCWGVLMHIPDVERALRELSRVLKPGGVLVISEGNRDSFQSLTFEGLKALLKLGDARRVKTLAGTEYWTKTAAGELMTRQADLGWLKNWLEGRAFQVRHHFAGQFTELYSRFRSQAVRKAIHLFNGLWFRYVKSPRLAFANILIVKKLGS